MTSIRKRLLVSILSTISLITALLTIATYLSIRHEMDELYDENMRQIAVVLASTGLEDEHMTLEGSSTKTTLKGEEEFLIQIWRNGKIAYTSHPAIHFSLQTQNKNGFGKTHFEDHKWKYFQLQDKADIIQISQDLHKRHDVIGEIYRALVGPILFQFPLMVLLIWVLVGYGFNPLTRVSDLIKKRTPTYLEPLPHDTAPVEVKALVDALNDLLVRLKGALELQRRFTTDAAHELRTPLAAIKLQLDLVKRASDPEEREEALLSLENGVSRSIRLAHQLLEMARHEPENLIHAFATLDLDEIINEVLEQSVSLATIKNIAVSRDTGHSLLVNGNASQLGIMIGNLVNNALLYTPENGHVRISAKAKARKIILDIADDGIGIAAKDRSRIFDRFYRVAGNSPIGSGLGLSIVKNIAASHDIEIDILEGLNGKGTTFRLTIPAA